MQRSESKTGIGAAAWTLTVIGIGLVAGAGLALIPRPDRPGPGPGPEAFQTLDDVDVVLSTVGVACLVALLVVYAKTFSDTGARFAIGLLFVLGALLFESVLTSPLLFGVFGHALGGLGPFVLVSDAFRATALSAFLYLSLQ